MVILYIFLIIFSIYAQAGSLDIEINVYDHKTTKHTGTFSFEEKGYYKINISNYICFLNLNDEQSYFDCNNFVLSLDCQSNTITNYFLLVLNQDSYLGSSIKISCLKRLYTVNRNFNGQPEFAYFATLSFRRFFRLKI